MAMSKPVCELCTMERAVVYCKSDLAALCLKCDGYVHAPNAISRRHPRSLICERCMSQPAVVRCLDEKLLLCQTCNGLCLRFHSCPNLTYYHDCPSLVELSKMFPFALQDCISSHGVNQNLFVNNCGESIKDVRINQESEDICSVDIDGMSLSFNSGYEIFENLQPRFHCDDGGLTALLMENNTSVAESKITLIENAIERDCIGMQPPPPVCGTTTLMEGMSSGMLINPNIGLFGENEQPLSSLPLIKWESGVPKSQDCGLSPLFLTGDSQWDSNFEAMSSLQARDKAKMRYNEKKKTRTYVIFLNSFQIFKSWMMH